MDALLALVDFILHVDQHLAVIVERHGAWTYGVLTAIIFCETGLVVTPFLPGDSLLFVAGTLAATGHMDVHVLFALLAAASFLGDNTNYWIGRFTGPRIFRSHQARLLNRAHLDRTRLFYERHGGKTIVIARFMPIVRTFAPFVAGIGRMNYAQFVGYSLVGSVFWISFFVYGGYLFGNIPLIRNNLTWFIIGIVVLSVLPGAITWLRSRAPATGGRAG